MKRKAGFIITIVALLVVLFTAIGKASAISDLAHRVLSGRNTQQLTLNQSGVPTIVSYQGQVSVGGVPYTGTGYFKFAIIDSAGSSSYWSNDSTSVNGSEPTNPITITVTSGLFNVLLGDLTIPGMTQPLDAAFGGPDRSLRVWFSDDNSTFQQLNPDRRIAAVPYALQAQEAALAGDADTLDGKQGSEYQALVSGICTTGSTIRVINPDGTVICETDADTNYTAGFGLGLDEAQFSVITSTIQQRADGICAPGSSIRLINADGTVECEPLNPVHSTYYPLLQAQTLNLASVDPDLAGFHVGFSDGRYGYFIPFYNGSFFGKVARVDLQNYRTSSVSILNLSLIDPDLIGFIGGFTDGRFGYFVPYNNGNSGKVVRVDLQNFTAGGVSVLDLTLLDTGLKGFAGGFTDGQYGYFVPYDNGNSGKVARIYLADFTLGGVDTLDLALVDPGLKGFVGGFTDGLYGYFVPYRNGSNVYSGKIARVDLQSFTTDNVTVLDLTSIDSSLAGYHGGFTVGSYAYFIPSNQGTGVWVSKLVRVDRQNFTTAGVTVLDLAQVDPGLAGFQGGFTDGYYGYFVPDTGGTSGKVARVDLANFTPEGVAWIDLSAYDATLTGFWGGFSDGRYGYFVPNWHPGGPLGNVARIQLFSGAGAP